MNNYTEKCKVLEQKYLNPSIYGNPKQWLYLENNRYGNHFAAKTATNALCGYMSFYVGKTYIFEYHYTNKGNIIIDYAKEVEQ